MSTIGEKKLSEEDRAEIEQSKPEDTDFRQQRLRAWQPLLTPKWVISTFFLVALIFLPIGIAIIVTSDGVIEYEVEYGTAGCATNPCYEDVKFTIDKDMSSPIYVYYKLTNFYQNHRRYVKSRSDPQLAGEGGSTRTCDPLETFGGKTLYPCGLVANSFFNDVFNVSVARWDGSSLLPNASLTSSEWTEKGIAWESDRDVKFKDLYKFPAALPATLTRDGPRGELPELDNEHFIVWMRTAGLPTFKKLYGKITTDLKKNDEIWITVTDNFPVDTFDGKKSLVLSTSSWIGGKNGFLGYAYIVVGALCLLAGIGFLVKHHLSPRELGDMRYFTWKTSE